MKENQMSAAEFQLWEQRRYEIAKDVAVALVGKLSYEKAFKSPNNEVDELVAYRSLEIADELIMRLREDTMDW